MRHVLILAALALTACAGDRDRLDRYGAAIALTSGTTTSRASSTADPFESFRASAGDVVLTANGSNFTGGVVRVVVHYIDLTAPGS